MLKLNSDILKDDTENDDAFESIMSKLTSNEKQKVNPFLLDVKEDKDEDFYDLNSEEKSSKQVLSPPSNKSPT